MLPRLSIITPSFNRSKYIEKAIQSVLHQNYTDVEHIIVDGGSTDGTLELLGVYPHLRIISEPDRGMYDALNKGLELAGGDIIGLLNSDDMYNADIFIKVAEKFQDESILAVVGEAEIYSIELDGRKKTVGTFSPAGASLLELSTIGNPFINAWFFRKSVFKSIGNFDINYQIAADRDFMLRFSLSNLPFETINKLVYLYLQHYGSMTLDITDQKLERIVSEHVELSDHYLKQNELSSETKSLISEFRSRDTIEMAFRNIKKLKISQLFQYIYQGNKYDRHWSLKLIKRILEESMNVMKKNAKNIYRSMKGFLVKIEVIVERFLAKIIAMILPVRLMRSKQLFDIWEKRGYHVTPVHFYEPIPDTRELPGDLWTRQSELLGIQINDQNILDRLLHFVNQYRQEYTAFPTNQTDIPHQFYINNGAFVSVDAEILYCIIRDFKPRRVIEIGSGNTTYLAAQAMETNRKEDPLHNCHLTAIEPYPVSVLKQGFPGLTRLVEKPIQSIPLSFFDELDDGDVLFIDSSHVAKIGSDVLYEYLEILPRLKKGVLIHVHDIFLPAQYPKAWIFSGRYFWNEQYLFQAFLLFNSAFEIIWPGSYIHLKYPDKLEEAFPSYNRQSTLPGSFWIRKTA